MFSATQRGHTLNGILLVALFAIAAYSISQTSWVMALGLSPLIVGILLGAIYGNTLHQNIPVEWHAGISFSARKILRLAIILYGFSITFQEIVSIGWQGVVLAAIVVATILAVGFWIGTKVLKMEPETALLTSAGSGICGAAAVLALEPVTKAQSHQTAVAVATVVVFGTLAMFLYPVLDGMQLFALSDKAKGLYFGSTLHEVAQVVGAASELPEIAQEYAVIEKMTRVLMIVPVILIVGWFMARRVTASAGKQSSLVASIPWFAVGFLAVAGFNSLDLLAREWVVAIHQLDTFLLTMAMVALGMETQISKMKQVGSSAFILAAILFVLLMFGGYFLVKLLGV
ncbi:YeiH family putative sulfate export transporter [Thiomicrorhabdus sp. 6S2-11]|uniref:YeiH family putative sulfate export transporter n=1 Tax=Thiomicrorhabdus marina TaxID=2818442 RepID=A0ABS3Q2C8_9GAMM|nr:YeiH family protein [Thiomicrorhabdus marina]MBO1926487.1 YeiH family putative sulfate export transporter [Thiomicrorhabdus marina]